MNRSRLENVRNTIRGLNAIQAGHSPAENEKVTGDAVRTHYPDRIATIDTLNMDTYHSEAGHGDDCRTLGCIAGVAIGLYARETRIIAKTADDTAVDPADIAQRILGLSDTQSHALFFSHPQKPMGIA